MKNLLIKNARLLDPVTGNERPGCIGIKNGRIAEIKDDLSSEGFDETVDAKGLVCTSALCDVHVHFRDPGQTYKEDILTGAAAAKRGGFATVITMANTVPTVSTPELIEYVLNEGKKTGIRVVPSATITYDLKGKELTDFDALYAAGAKGFTDDGIPITDEKIVIAAMNKAKELGVPLSFHEELPSFIKNPGVNHGKVSEAMGLYGAESAAEYVMIARDVMLALATGACVDIQHISSKEGVELVRFAKGLGADVHAEATPHHFSLTEEAVLKHGTLAKMNPPLRTEADRQAIIEGLKDGTIDLIATDHAPHSSEEKSREFIKSPSGITGLETSLALAVTNLVRPGHLSLADVLLKMSYNPLKLYGLDGGTLETGDRGDLVIFDPDEEWTFESTVSKSSNTPFLGQKLFGRVHMTIAGGEIVYRI